MRRVTAVERDGSTAPRVVGLFAGIGGMELGLARAGFAASLLCEIDPAARAVLSTRFPGVPVERDVRRITTLPAGTSLLAAGFPCQDLSQAGSTRGISGGRSGLVAEVFRILRRQSVPTVLLENVPFMLQLGRGEAMRYLAERFEELGYRWAYRVIDSRSFGVPQRRERVYLVAARDFDPAPILFQGNAEPPEADVHHGRPCGFYWTEGQRGLGWAVDHVPTLKGGSTIGIPSPPAIWWPDGRITTPDIRDAERLQGFPAGWTEPACEVARPSMRWKLVGNAVTVRVIEWIGERLLRRSGTAHWGLPARPVDGQGAWPRAAYFDGRGRFAVEVTTWPVRRSSPPLAEFLRERQRPLSARATAGFLRRLRSSTLRYPPEFERALAEHLGTMTADGGLEASRVN